VPCEPPPITTYAGTVDGDPDSRVVASLVGGELEASNQQGFLVLTQQNIVNTLTLNAVGQAALGTMVGAPLGTHIYGQFVVYSDNTYTTIVAVSNVTDSIVVQ